MGRLSPFLGSILVAVGVGVGAAHVPQLLGRLEFFRVRAVQYQGGRFLPEDEARSLLPLGSGASVWDDLATWEEALQSHPLVASAEVERVLPDTVRVRVTERAPVAYFPAGALEPVDRTGRILPIDPLRNALNLPILAPELEGSEGALLTPGQLRILAEEAGRLTDGAPRTLARISELALGPDRNVVIRLMEPGAGGAPVEIWYRAPVRPHTLTRAMAALDDARIRFPDRAIRTVDLRFQEQVVVRFADRGRS